ncbi:YegJ family protein [Rhodopseudomonas telluris]|uniref:YegJ family protein n=1 Tax=Rhodopseudomonas telluris TaxID=644215 RepID=A0ABV6EPW2_9BRAD
MLLVFLMSLVALIVTPSGAQSLIDKAARDETARVRTDDADMTAAIAKARAALDGFLARADHPADNQRDFSVKVKVPLGANSEFLWLRPFVRDGDGFVGRVVNTPRYISNLKYGDRLSFERKDIADWSYKQDGRMIGNFTACVLIARAPPDQRVAFRETYGIDCDP